MNISIRRILFWTTIFLVAFSIWPPQARADGVHGVRETAREFLVDVPLSCSKSVEFVWEAKWKWAADNEDAVFAFPQKDKGQKIVVQYIRPGAFKFHALWRGGETVRIPKFDAKGNPIKMEFLSILALGGGEKLLNKNNWSFIFADGRVVDISPPVNEGVWGNCT